MTTGQGSAGNVIAALCSVFIPGLGQLVQGRLLHVRASVGVATRAATDMSPGDLLRNADLAMYEAKEAREGTSVFGAAAGGRAMRQLAISSGFRAAPLTGLVSQKPQRSDG